MSEDLLYFILVLDWEDAELSPRFLLRVPDFLQSISLDLEVFR